MRRTHRMRAFAITALLLLAPGCHRWHAVTVTEPDMREQRLVGKKVRRVGADLTTEMTVRAVRYPFVEVNYFRSLETIFREGTDFELTDDGTIRWLGSAAPAVDTRLTVHGAVRPVWICMDHMHTYRDTLVEKDRGPTRAEQFTRLPLQMVVKLDFLLES